MIQQFMKMGGVRTEEEFYTKYPTEQSFFEAFPQAQQYIRQYQAGGPKGQNAIIQVVKAVASKLGMQPEQLMQAIQQDPQVLQQLSAMAQQDPQQAADALMQMVQQSQQQAQKSMPVDPNQAMQMAFGGSSQLSKFVNGGSYPAAAPMYDNNVYRTFPPNMPRLFGSGGMYQAPDDENSNETDGGRMMQVPSNPGMTIYDRGIVTPQGVYVPVESEGPVKPASGPMRDASATASAPGTATMSSLNNLKKNKVDPTGLTVSEIWQKVTGTPWSEAKKQGLTDGSYNQNIELRKMLLEGNLKKKSSGTKTSKPTPYISKAPSSSSSTTAQEGSPYRAGTKDYYKNITNPFGYTAPQAEEQLPDQINDYDMEGNPIYVDNQGNKYLYKDGKKVSPKDVTYDSMRGAGTGQYYKDFTSQYGYTEPTKEDQLPDQINNYDSEGNPIYVDSKGKMYQYYGESKVHPGTTLPYNQPLKSGSNTPGSAPKKGSGDYYQEKKKTQQAKPKEKGMLEKAGDVFSEFYRNNPWMRKHGGSHMPMLQPGGTAGSGVIDAVAIKENLKKMDSAAGVRYINSLGDSTFAALLQQDPDILNYIDASRLSSNNMAIAQGYANQLYEEDAPLPAWAYGVIGGLAPAATLGVGYLGMQAFPKAPIDPGAFVTGKQAMAPFQTLQTMVNQRGVPFPQTLQEMESYYLTGRPKGPHGTVDFPTMKYIREEGDKLFKELQSNYIKLNKGKIIGDKIPPAVLDNLREQASMIAATNHAASSGLGQQAAKNLLRVAKTRQFAGAPLAEIGKQWVGVVGEEIDDAAKMSNFQKTRALLPKVDNRLLWFGGISALTGTASYLYGSTKQKDQEAARIFQNSAENAANASGAFSANTDSTGNLVNQAATITAPGSTNFPVQQPAGPPKGYMVNGVQFNYAPDQDAYIGPDSSSFFPDEVPQGAKPFRRGGVNQQGPLGYGAYNVVFMDGGESAGPGFYTPDSVIGEKKNALLDFVESQKQMYKMRYGGSNFSKKKKG